MVRINLVRNKLELQRDKRKPKIAISRKALLRAALKRLAISRTLWDRFNREHKSRRMPAQQDKYEARIIRITTSRYKLLPNQQFPLRAIIKMADLGVREAINQYTNLHQAAQSLNISIRDAYDHLVLGKELNNLRKAHEPT